MYTQAEPDVYELELDLELELKDTEESDPDDVSGPHSSGVPGAAARAATARPGRRGPARDLGHICGPWLVERQDQEHLVHQPPRPLPPHPAPHMF